VALVKYRGVRFLCCLSLGYAFTFHVALISSHIHAGVVPVHHFFSLHYLSHALFCFAVPFAKKQPGQLRCRPFCALFSCIVRTYPSSVDRGKETGRTKGSGGRGKKSSSSQERSVASTVDSRRFTITIVCDLVGLA